MIATDETGKDAIVVPGLDHAVLTDGRGLYAKSLFDDLANAPGYLPALDADYRVGSVVISAILENWATCKVRPPVP